MLPISGIYKVIDLCKNTQCSCWKIQHWRQYFIQYLHELDLYEIKYIDASVFGETHGWFHHTDFHSTNELQSA